MTITKSAQAAAISFSVPILFSLILILVTQLSVPPFFGGENERFSYGIVGSLIAFLVVYYFLKRDENLKKQYSLTLDRSTLRNMLLGSITGVFLAFGMFAVQVGVSGLQIEWTGNSLGSFAFFSLSLIPLAFMEELAFRSYPFFKLKSVYGVWAAQIIMATLFALYHYAGGWTLFASFFGPFIWSFAFGWLALKSNGIALPTGFHFGLNLALAVIGDKDWVPGLISINYASEPTTAQVASNEWVGVALQGFVFIGLIVLTFKFSRKDK